MTDKIATYSKYGTQLGVFERLYADDFIVGDNTTTFEGSVRYNSGKFQGRDATGWKYLGVASSSGSGNFYQENVACNDMVIGTTSTDTEGRLRYTGGNLQVRDATEWKKVYREKTASDNFVAGTSALTTVGGLRTNDSKLEAYYGVGAPYDGWRQIYRLGDPFVLSNNDQTTIGTIAYDQSSGDNVYVRNTSVTTKTLMPPRILGSESTAHKYIIASGVIGWTVAGDFSYTGPFIRHGSGFTIDNDDFLPTHWSLDITLNTSIAGEYTYLGLASAEATIVDNAFQAKITRGSPASSKFRLQLHTGSGVLMARGSTPADYYEYHFLIFGRTA